MPSAFSVPLPSVAQVEAVLRATSYSYEAGEYPDDMDEFTEAFVVGDGGLLKSLICLKRALELLEVERVERARLVEDWHGRAVASR